jgi:hypothetical protein
MFEMIMCGSRYPLFPTVILEINKNVISVNAIDQTRAIGTNQEYTGFEIEGSANIPIDTVSISEAIKLFDDNDLIKLTYDENKIILSTNSNNKKDTITIPTMKINEINNESQITFNKSSITINGNEMNFDAHVIVDASHIQNQIKKGSFIGNLYHEYLINIDGTKLTLIVGDPNNYETSSSSEIVVENGKGSCQSSYAHGYDDIFKSLSGNVEIYINDRKPMLIVQTNDEFNVKFLIAAIIRE